MFATFGEDHSITSMIISTSCPGFFISGLSFPSMSLDHRISINEQGITIKSNLLNDVHSVNEFLRIRQPSLGYAVTMDFYFNGSVNGEIRDAQLFIFGSVFTTSLTLTSEKLTFGSLQMNTIYKKSLETKAFGRIINDADSLALTILGEITDANFLDELEVYIREFILNEVNILNDRLGFILKSKEAIQKKFFSYSDMVDTQNKSLFVHKKMLDAAKADLEKLDMLVEQYQNDVDALSANHNSSLFLNLLSICELDNCSNECAVMNVCDLCETDIPIDEWGIGKSTDLENVTVNHKKSIENFEWSTEYLCRLITKIKSWGVSSYGQICSYKSAYSLKMERKWVSEANECAVSHYRPVVIDSHSVPVTGSCFSGSTCGLYLEDSQCLISNVACQIAQLKAISSLTKDEAKTVEALVKLLHAKSNQTIASMKVKQYQYKHDIAECKYKFLKNMLMSINDLSYSAVNNYDMLSEEFSYIAEIEQLLFNTTAKELIKVHTISFDVTFTERSPSSFPIEIVYEVPYLNRSYESLISVDFTSLDSIIKRDIASSIVRQIGKELKGARRKRDCYDEHPTLNEQRFEQYCASIGSVKEYMLELHSTFKNIENEANKLKLKMQNHSSYSLAGFSDVDNLNIDVSILEKYFQYTTSKQMLFNLTLSSHEYSSLVDTLEEIELVLGNITKSIDETLPMSWWITMSKTHSIFYLASVGNKKCYGFADCLMTSFQILKEIIEDSPLAGNAPVVNMAQLQNAWGVTRKLPLDDMLTNSIWNLIEPLYNITHELEANTDWCSMAPVVEQFDPIIYVEIESDLIIKCGDDKTVQYQWLKDGFLYQENSVLMINGAKKSDKGQYHCSATSEVGTTLSTIFTLIVYIPPVMTLSPSNVTTYEGNEDDALFVCNATGYPTPSYSWYFSSDKISWKTVDSSSNEYVVHKPTKNEEGWYRCGVSMDNHGDIDFSDPAFLTVIGASISRISYPVEFRMAIYAIDQLHHSTDNYIQGLHESVKNAIKRNKIWEHGYIENMKMDVDYHSSTLHVAFHISAYYHYSLTTSIADQALEANGYSTELLSILDNMKNRLMEASISFEYVGDFFYAFPHTYSISEAIYKCPDGQKILENDFICSKCLIIYKNNLNAFHSGQFLVGQYVMLIVRFS